MPDPAALSPRPFPRGLDRLRWVLALGLVFVVFPLALASPVAASQPGNAYRQTDLVSDLPAWPR
jgi:hypothetical protein